MKSTQGGIHARNETVQINPDNLLQGIIHGLCVMEKSVRQSVVIIYSEAAAMGLITAILKSINDTTKIPR